MPNLFGTAARFFAANARRNPERAARWERVMRRHEQ